MQFRTQLWSLLRMSLPRPINPRLIQDQVKFTPGQRRDHQKLVSRPRPDSSTTALVCVSADVNVYFISELNLHLFISTCSSPARSPQRRQELWSSRRGWSRWTFTCPSLSRRRTTTRSSCVWRRWTCRWASPSSRNALSTSPSSRSMVRWRWLQCDHQNVIVRMYSRVLCYVSLVLHQPRVSSPSSSQRMPTAGKMAWLKSPSAGRLSRMGARRSPTARATSPLRTNR